jgi:hypothetical protein
MSDNLDTTIQEAAEGPASVSTDAGTVTSHNLKDLIEADRYLASKRAAATRRRGIRVSKIVTSGPGE